MSSGTDGERRDGRLEWRCGETLTGVEMTLKVFNDRASARQLTGHDVLLSIISLSSEVS